MSRFVPSEPNAAQSRLMKRLGFSALDTDDSMTAVWSLSVYTLHLPASWAPADEADLMSRILGSVHGQGIDSARRQMRHAFGMS